MVLTSILLLASCTLSPSTDKAQLPDEAFENSPDCHPDLQRHVSSFACQEHGRRDVGYLLLRYRKALGGQIDLENLALHSSRTLCGSDSDFQWMSWQERRVPVKTACGSSCKDLVYFEVQVRCTWLDELMEPAPPSAVSP